MQQNSVMIEKLILDGRQHLSLTGVDAVDGFSEQFLRLTVMGSKVVINGENIKISSFNKQTGNLTADGNFYEIKYNYKKQPFMKRLFK